MNVYFASLFASHLKILFPELSKQNHQILCPQNNFSLAGDSGNHIPLNGADDEIDIVIYLYTTTTANIPNQMSSRLRTGDTH